MISQAELTDLIIEKLDNKAEDIRKQWNNSDSKVAKFFYVDDLLPEVIVRQIYECFPKSEENWTIQNSFRERKKTLAKIKSLDPLISDITYAIQSEKVMRKVEELTGVFSLEADPFLYAGGVSMMSKGDFLNPHIDNSHDRDRKMYRKLNLLFYVSPNWKQEYGGNLELWDAKVKRPVEIVSRFNRLVVMGTDKKSWHSVNKVQVDAHRCCVSNYLFAKNYDPYPKEYYHVTSFMGRPGETCKRAISHFDNFLRQSLASGFGVSRGRKLVNEV